MASDKKDKSKEEFTADFPRLIELVRNEDNGHMEFYHLDPRGRPTASERVPTGRTSREGDEVVSVPPPSVPWPLPRRQHVERFFKEDTNAKYFRAVVAYLERHIDLPSAAYVVFLAAWIVHTHIVDWISATPHIFLPGPPETGKSRTLAACLHAARRGILTNASREAAMIRYADEYHATLGLDVIDFMEQIKEMKDFYAARTYRDGTVTTRVLDYQKGRFQGMQHYEAYGPTMVVSNYALSDAVISSRTLTIPVHKSTRQFGPRPTADMGLELRERGAAFRARTFSLKLRNDLPTPHIAEGRLGEILEGLALVVELTDPAQIRFLKAWWRPSPRSAGGSPERRFKSRYCVTVSVRSGRGRPGKSK